MTDENHVSEILRTMPKGISAKAFMVRARAQGWPEAEVEEAFGRAFRVVAHIDGPGRNNFIVYEPGE